MGMKMETGKNICKDNHILSIIVPVYNAATTILRCLESILNQSYKDFELVLVDDGSTDKSLALCEAYVQKDNRVTVLHIKNVGPFQARKAGAKVAKGDVLMFSDADDWFKDDAIERVMDLMNKHTPDMIAFEYVCENRGREKYFYEEKLYCGEEIQKVIIPKMMYDTAAGKGFLNPSLCCKAIRKEIFIQITESVKNRITLGDDALVTYPAVCMAEKIYIYNKALYHYRDNGFSCTHSFPPQRLSEIKMFQENIVRLLEEVGQGDGQRYQVECYIRFLLSMMIKKWYRLELSSISFKFPRHLVRRGNRVLIYGAGDVGKSYINNLKNDCYAEIAGWVDREYRKIKSYRSVEVTDPNSIGKNEFDTLLIAVWNEDTAYEIKGSLIKMGIPEEKIIWERPLHIL